MHKNQLLQVAIKKMIVDYDKDNNQFEFLKAYKSKTYNKDTLDFISQFKYRMDNNVTSIDFDGWASGFKNADKEVVSFAKDVTTGAASMDSFNKSVSATSVAGGKFASVMSGVGSALKSIGATTLNMAAMWVITETIGLAITAIDNYIHRWENAVEAGEEARSKISEAFDSYNNQVTTIEDLGKQFASNPESINNTADAIQTLTERYAELKRGVNRDNSNGNLSENEYQQYLDISNQLADILPGVSAGIDVNGNALLNLSNNAATAATQLDDLLQKQMAVAHADISENLDDAFKGAYADANKITGSTKYVTLKNISEKDRDILDEFLSQYGGGRAGGYGLEQEDGTWNVAYEIDPTTDYAKLHNVLGSMNSLVMSENEQLASTLEDLYVQQIEQDSIWSTFANESVKPFLETSNTLMDIPAELTNAIENNLSNIDWSSLYNTYDGDAEEMLLKEFVTPLSELDKPAQEALAEALKLDPSKLSIDEYQDALSDALSKVSNDKDVQEKWREKFGFDGIVEDAENQADALKKQFKDIDDTIDSLSGEDRELSYQIAIEDEEFNGSWQDVMKKISTMKDEMENPSTFNLTLFETQVADAIALIDTLNAALINSYSGKGLSVTYEESDDGVITLTGDIANLQAAYADLEAQGYDTSSMFEKTANGVHINREALRQLQAAQEAMNKAEWLEDQKTLTEQLATATDKLKEAQSSGNAEDIASAQSQVDSLQSQLETVQLLTAAYDGATSAYQKWVNAQSAGEEGDMYRTVSETMRERGSELYKEGRYNTEEFRAIAQYYSNQDLSTASMEQVVAAYQQGVDAINRYFTGDKTGIDNFIHDVQTKVPEAFETVVDEAGNERLKFNIDTEDLANQLHISEEAIEAVLRGASEYTDDIILGDTSGLDDLTQKLSEATAKAQEAKNNLKSLQDEGKISTDIELDVDVSELDESGIEERISELTDLKAEAEIKFGAESSEVEYVDQLLEEANARKEQLAYETKCNISIDISGEDDITALSEKLSNIPDGETANVSINISNADQIENALNQLNQIPENTSANISFSVQNQEQADALEEKLNALEAESGKEISYSISITGDDVSSKVSGLTDGISGGEVTVSANVVGSEKIQQLKSDIASLSDKTVNISTNTSGSENITALKQNIASIPIAKTSNITATTIGEQAVKSLKAAIDAVLGKQVDVSATVIGTSDVNALVRAISGVVSKAVTISATTSGTSSVQSLATAISNVQSKTVTITSITNKIDNSTFNGTAHIYGTAFAHGSMPHRSGDWSVKQSERALVGELGQETVIRNGRFFTVGDRGAEFVSLQRGDVVLNHKQSEELFKNGHVTSGGGRAKVYMGGAFVSGSAYASGSWVFGNTGGGNLAGTGSSYTPSKSPSKSPSTSSSAKSTQKAAQSAADSVEEAADEFEETFDWIEIAIDRIERAIDQLDLKASSVYRTWSERNSNLVSEISKVSDEIALQQKGYTRYIQQANSVGLSSDWAAKVRDGNIDINTITDEDLADKIKEYQDW